MVSKIISIVEEIINLLAICGYTSQVEWFKERLEILSSNTSDSEIVHETLAEIRSVLGGMGSLSDLSMVPVDSSKMTREQANQLKWELIDLLDEEVAKELA